MLFLQHVALNCSVVVSLIKQTKIQQTRSDLIAEQRGLSLQVRVKKRLSISLIKSTPILLTLLSSSERYCFTLTLIMTNKDFQKPIRTLQKETDRLMYACCSFFSFIR